jgi:hypothetical protein
MFGVTLLLILLATLSKEQGLMTVVVCASYDFFVSLRLNIWELLAAMTFGWLDPFGLHIKGSKGKGLSTTRIRDQLFWASVRCAAVRGLLLLGFAVALFVHRVSLFNGDPPKFSKMENPGGGADEWLTRVLTLNYYAFFHAILLAWPQHLCHDWTGSSIPLLTSPADSRNLQWPFLPIAVGLLVYKAFFSFEIAVAATVTDTGDKKAKNKGRANADSDPLSDPPSVPSDPANFDRGAVLALGTSLLIAPFLPASNLFFTVGFPVAERVLYTPSLGFVLLFVVTMDSVIGKSGAGGATRLVMVAGAATMVAAVYAQKLMVRDLEWSTPTTLYTSATESNPTNGQVTMQHPTSAQHSQPHSHTVLPPFRCLIVPPC